MEDPDSCGAELHVDRVRGTRRDDPQVVQN